MGSMWIYCIYTLHTYDFVWGTCLLVLNIWDSLYCERPSFMRVKTHKFRTDTGIDWIFDWLTSQRQPIRNDVRNPSIGIGVNILRRYKERIHLRAMYMLIRSSLLEFLATWTATYYNSGPRHKRYWHRLNMALHSWMGRGLIFLSLVVYTVATTCNVTYTQRPRSGFLCQHPTNITITSLSRGQCLWHCMHQNTCHVISYEPESHECRLSPGCESIYPSPVWDVTVLGPERSSCLKWMANVDRDRANKVWSYGCQQHAIYPDCVVGRLLSPPHVLPGKYFLHADSYSGGCWSILEGASYSTGELEVLHVEPNCVVAWIPYTAGDPLPEGAVVGGNLVDDGTVSTLYVIQGVVDGHNVIGYFDSTTQTGHVLHSGDNPLTEMNMLVLFWRSAH